MSEGARISTTHVGSLPRPQEVVDLVFAEDRDEPIDRTEYDRVMGEAVRDRVRHQVDAGIDLVSDGTLDAYLEAIGEAMKIEYEAIVAAGVHLQMRRTWPWAATSCIATALTTNSYRASNGT